MNQIPKSASRSVLPAASRGNGSSRHPSTRQPLSHAMTRRLAPLRPCHLSACRKPASSPDLADLGFKANAAERPSTPNFCARGAPRRSGGDAHGDRTPAAPIGLGGRGALSAGYGAGATLPHRKPAGTRRHGRSLPRQRSAAGVDRSAQVSAVRGHRQRSRAEPFPE